MNWDDFNRLLEDSSSDNSAFFFKKAEENCKNDDLCTFIVLMNKNFDSEKKNEISLW